MEKREKRYLFQSDIKEILGISRTKANEVFKKAYAIDAKELGDCILYKRKVRAASVKKVTKENW